MKNLLFTLRYDGTDYHGWQVQENANTVQQTFQDAAERICGVRDNVIGCSRTDSGVHADMYCCNMRTESSLSPEKWKSAMNGVLPHDIAVTDCREVPFEFHARYDCSGKRYVYRIWNAQERNPFISRYSYHYKYPLDADFLNRQASQMLGTHDFSAFCAAGASTVDNVRTLTRAEVVRRGDEVLMYFEADGFLYNMVRIMVGTLLDISKGQDSGRYAARYNFITQQRQSRGRLRPPADSALSRFSITAKTKKRGCGKLAEKKGQEEKQRKEAHKRTLCEEKRRINPHKTAGRNKNSKRETT